MVVVIAVAIGLIGGWTYAGCPVPGALRRAVSSRRPTVQERPVDGISRKPAPGASTAAP